MLIISINFVTEYTQELARASIFGYSMSPGQKMFLYKKKWKITSLFADAVGQNGEKMKKKIKVT